MFKKNNGNVIRDEHKISLLKIKIKNMKSGQIKSQWTKIIFDTHQFVVS